MNAGLGEGTVILQYPWGFNHPFEVSLLQGVGSEGHLLAVLADKIIESVNRILGFDYCFSVVCQYRCGSIQMVMTNPFRTLSIRDSDALWLWSL